MASCFLNLVVFELEAKWKLNLKSSIARYLHEKNYKLSAFWRCDKFFEEICMFFLKLRFYKAEANVPLVLTDFCG